ncbi:helix-turn-helix domain-containing protein [Streptomyces montanisoli]|uniref:Helix-turn-helix transcriptional regulator n=1 Tax=Streptomyces montanisoli TaxID=2798581 RepID=A0A940RZF4_9ACTN|nr:helix-turn-helix transcriptional regulator [Streptomyces montanisoli]MBP0459729.1 helix-turn-helix transcriptional regulator [Streptomyces montanisoli]
MARSENKETAGTTTRYVARIARILRKQKGLSQEELGKEIGFTGSAVSAMETGSQPASDQMLEALERVLGDGLGIFDEAREFVRLDKYPRKFKDFAPLEQRAVAIYVYETHLINGLFQTEEYARSVIGGSFPPPTDEKVEELVEARMARKALFSRRPTALVEVIVDESALRRQLGGRKVMSEQLRRLAEVARLRNVTIQVLALDAGLRGEYAGERGSLTLIETPEDDRFVYLELQDESLLIKDSSKVRTYAQRYAKIRAQALSPDDSLALIERLAGED